MKAFWKMFNAWDIALWSASVLAILLSFFLCGNTDYMQLATSLIGACSLILISKGNVAGQFLVVTFSICYGTVSFFFRYYGEMITYLGMTAPIAVMAIVGWMRHPYKRDGHTEVKVNRISKKELLLLAPLAAAVTVAFYFILRAFHTANLVVGTLSVLTSFLAMYLSMRRCWFYAVAYMLNDIVLIVLWSLAAAENGEYLAMVVCFSVFLVNDINGFIQWGRMKRRQSGQAETSEEQG